MQRMYNGTRVHVNKAGSFDAEAVVNGEVVWSQTNFLTQAEAEQAAEKAFEQMRQHR